jgi:signal recognition particle subunit SRP54
MFETLTKKLDEVFSDLRGRGKVTEEDVEESMKEIRRVLLAADVHYSVVKEFINDIKEKATGEEVLESLSPGEQVVKIVRDELTDLLGGEEVELDLGQAEPAPIMLVGLQGTGKTTTCAKLAQHYRQDSKNPLLISTDDQRPAAQDQLEQLANEHDLSMHTHDMEDVPSQLEEAAEEARVNGQNPMIIDTAGRLSIDEPMIEEVEQFTSLLPETKVLLVLDAMMGQEALQVAQDFHDSVELDGLVLTKMDGDARGGAAISAREVTGVPIVFIGTGESIDDLQPFYPERMAGRILGMGDVMSLIEEAEQVADEEEQKEMQERMMEGEITMDDVDKQLDQLKQMGPLEGILEKLPGGFQLKDQMDHMDLGKDDINRMQAIIRSMTEEERRDPDIIDGSRRKRIADGSGTDPADVNQLLKQYEMMKNMMEQMQNNEGMMQKMAGEMGMGNMGGMGGMFGQ